MSRDQPRAATQGDRRLCGRAALLGWVMREGAARSSRRAASGNAAGAVAALTELHTFLRAVRILARNCRLRSARIALFRVLFSADLTFGKGCRPTEAGPAGAVSRLHPEKQEAETYP